MRPTASLITNNETFQVFKECPVGAAAAVVSTYVLVLSQPWRAQWAQVELHCSCFALWELKGEELTSAVQHPNKYT
jgi:hypothetical protein